MASIADRLVEAAGPATPERLAVLATDPSPQVRRQVAANAATPVAVLATMVADRDWRTRAVLAARPGMPVASQVQLVDDKAWQVRLALAGNAGADPSVWAEITTAQHQDVRQVLAGEEWLPESVATLLSHDQSKEVRQDLASQTPHRSVLELLLGDPHQDVRAAALRNSLIVETDAINASHDRHLVVRAHAARCAKLPESDRRRLTTDRSDFVRSEAASGPFHEHRPFTAATEGALPDFIDLQTFATWPATPTKPATKWFKIFSSYRLQTDDVPDHVAPLWRLGAKIDAAEAWIGWWRESGAHTLDIAISAGPNDSVAIERRGQTVYARSTSAEAWRLAGTADSAGLEPADLAKEIELCLLQQLKWLLDEVAKSLQLLTPPPLPGLSDRGGV